MIYCLKYYRHIELPKELSINTTPYSLVFGHDASMRVTQQNELTHLDYQDAMFLLLGI